MSSKLCHERQLIDLPYHIPRRRHTKGEELDFIGVKRGDFEMKCDRRVQAIRLRFICFLVFNRYLDIDVDIYDR